MEGKKIRFIDSRYNKLFTVPDGGKIQIAYFDGNTAIRACEYLDDCHVRVGSDIHGNITRLNNALEGFGSKLQSCKEKLEGVISQMEAAKIEVENPFPQEDELKQKSERLNELNVLLNMDEKDHTLIDGEPDIENDEPGRAVGMER